MWQNIKTMQKAEKLKFSSLPQSFVFQEIFCVKVHYASLYG